MRTADAFHTPENHKGYRMDFFCQACDFVIDVEMIAELDGGKCPSCGKLEGFGTVPKLSMPSSAGAHILNDTDFSEMESF